MSDNAIITKHGLDFLAADSPYGDDHKLFRIGTCDGQWYSLKDSYCILSVINSTPGNGHLDDVFEWFEFSCKRDAKNLIVLECMNERFAMHLIEDRGFVPLDDGNYNVIKIFNQKRYKRLLRKGNEILQAGSMKCI